MDTGKSQKKKGKATNDFTIGLLGRAGGRHGAMCPHTSHIAPHPHITNHSAAPNPSEIAKYPQPPARSRASARAQIADGRSRPMRSSSSRGVHRVAAVRQAVKANATHPCDAHGGQRRQHQRHEPPSRHPRPRQSRTRCVAAAPECTAEAADAAAPRGWNHSLAAS